MAKNQNRTINPDSSPNTEDYIAYEDGRDDDPGYGAGALIIEVLEIPHPDQGGHNGETVTTCYCGCGSATRKGSMYLQGHDATAKGKLIRAGRAGVEVALVGMGGNSSSDALTMASSFASTDGFVAKVREGIERPAKATKAPRVKATKNNPAGTLEGKAAAQVEPNPYGVTKTTTAKLREVTGEGLAQAKVGRWVKEGTVIDGEFHYMDAKGARKITTKYTLVD